MTQGRISQLSGLILVGFSTFVMIASSSGKSEHLKTHADSDKAWGIGLHLDHTLGSGMFTADNPSSLPQTDLVLQGWSLNGHYTFDLAKIPLSVESRFGFAYLLKEPQTNPAMEPINRFDSNLSFAVYSDELYREDTITGLLLRLGAQADFPFNIESDHSVFAGGDDYEGSIDPILKKRGFLALRGWLGLFRDFGPAHVGYTFTCAKYINSSKVETTESIEPLAQLDSAPAGFANTDFALAHDLFVGFTPFDWFQASYSLGFITYYKYKLGQGRGTLDLYNPTLDLSFFLAEMMQSWLNLPAQAAISLGIQAFHPTRTASGDAFLPLFYTSFNHNRATLNYASVYLRLSAQY